MDIRFITWHEVLLLYDLTFLIMLHIKHYVGSDIVLTLEANGCVKLRCPRIVSFRVKSLCKHFIKKNVELTIKG